MSQINVDSIYSYTNPGNGPINVVTSQINVIGNTNTNTLQVTSGATDGYVLTSDALGNATWQTVQYVFSTGGTNNIIAKEGNNSIVINPSFPALPNYSIINGGQNNTITDASSSFSSILGGKNNELLNAFGSTVVSGQFNKLTNTTNSSVINGSGNYILDSTNSSTLGSYNTVDDSYSSHVGGYSNYITSGGWINSVTGGYSNSINYGYANFIGNGGNNTLGIPATPANGTYYSSIVGGMDNKVVGAYSSIIGGKNNYVNNSSYSSILGGNNNLNTHANSHIIGSNITSVAINTTHVEQLNVGTVITGSTATEVLVRENDGMINTVNLSTFTQQKYVTTTLLTASTPQTVTHNLNDTDVIVQLKDSVGTVISNYLVTAITNNSVDIEVSSTDTYKIIIIG